MKNSRLPRRHGISRRRALTWGAAAAAAGLGVGGCVGDRGPERPDASERPVPEERRLSGRVVVAVWPPPPQSAREGLTVAYNARQPDVEIVWEGTAVTDAEVYRAWLAAVLDAEEPAVDLVSGALAPSGSTTVEFVPMRLYRSRTNPYTGRAWRRDYRFLDRPGGGPTVIGTELVRPFWYYNADLFAAAEVDPPTTWMELVEVTDRLREFGSDPENEVPFEPIAVDLRSVLYDWLPTIYFDQFHVDWVDRVRVREGDWNFDPRVDPDFELDVTAPGLHARYTFSRQRFYRALRDGTLRFDTAQVEQIVENLSQVFGEYVDPDPFPGTEPYARFLGRGAAMMVDSSSMLAPLRRDLEGVTEERAAELGVDAAEVESFEWGVFEFPSMRDSLVISDARQPEAAGGYSLSVIDREPERTDLAMDFTMFWLSEPGYRAFVDAAVEAEEFMPSGPPLVRRVQYPEPATELVDPVERTGVVPAEYAGFWVRGTGEGVAVDLEALFGQAIRGDLTPRGYARRLQDYMEQNLRAMYRTEGLTGADLDTPARRPAGV